MRAKVGRGCNVRAGLDLVLAEIAVVQRQLLDVEDWVVVDGFHADPLVLRDDVDKVLEQICRGQTSGHMHGER